jgi:polyhydroxybutyrate depolymerase
MFLARYNMKKIFFTLLLLGSCMAATTAQFSNKTMDVDGNLRSYRQYLPTGFNAATEPGLPLIIALHGIGDNMTNFSGVGFNYIADTARFIVVFPQGKPNILSQNSWNNGTLLASPDDDIHYLSMLMDTMKVKYNIDLSRIYFTGFSMGGIMSHHMVCALPSRIAAIASVSGPMSDADVAACNPGRPVPVMHMHGTADGTVPYNTGALPSLSLVPTTLAFWQNNNGCADSVIYNLPNLVPGDGITVDTVVFSTCNAPVIHWRENGADHQWLYRPVNDIDATTEIWLFFRDKVHPAPSQLSLENAQTSGGISISYFEKQLTIKNNLPIQEVVVLDIQGRILVELEANNQTEWSVNLSEIPSQPVLVQVKSGGVLNVHKFVHIQ